jgi:hypothetical protein
MTNFIRFTFIFLFFGFTALVRAFVVLKMKSKKGPKQRSKKNATMTSKIEEIKSTDICF